MGVTGLGLHSIWGACAGALPQGRACSPDSIWGTGLFSASQMGPHLLSRELVSRRSLAPLWA